MKLKHCIAALLLLLAIYCTPVIAHAQDDGSGIDDPDGGTPVPFDGGISILIAAGVAYGLKKKYDHKKHTTEE